MKLIQELSESSTIEEIEEEIKQRQDLRHKMVGQLYPNILTDEIYKLRMLVYKLQSIKNHEK